MSSGPRVAFQAAIGGTTFLIGDDLGEQEGEIELMATFLDGPEILRA